VIVKAPSGARDQNLQLSAISHQPSAISY